MPPQIARLLGTLERVCRTGSPGLARMSMLLGPDFPSRWLSMGDFHQEGSPLSGGAFPLPRVFGTVDVAPEGAQLISSGLSTEFAVIILQSRAPSTRKLYSLK